MPVSGMKIHEAAGVLLVVGLVACQSSGSSSPVASVEPSPSAVASQASSATGKILFARLVRSTDQWLVFTMKPDGSDERRIDLPGSNGGPHWSPDGSRLLAYADNDQGLLFVGIADADGSGWTLLHSPDPTLNLGCSEWSPDSSRLACQGWDDGDPSRAGIYTVRASDGGDLVRLTTTPAGFADSPGPYAPDGTRLLFSRDNLDGVTPGTTNTVNVDGTGQRELPVHYGGGLQWAPDGSGILAGKAGTLFVLDASGEHPVPILIEAFPGYESGCAFYGLWSPDMQHIVFSYAATCASPPDLFVMNADGTGLTQLTRTADDEEEPGGWSR
jgi:Tol biopolymer transport system component